MLNRWVSWFLDLACVNCSRLSTSKTASGQRQNISTNRLRTCIWSFTRILLDYLAATRSSTIGKLLAFLLGNLWPPLPRVARVGWSCCWRPKSHIGFIWATFFSHHYYGCSHDFYLQDVSYNSRSINTGSGIMLISK